MIKFIVISIILLGSFLSLRHLNQLDNQEKRKATQIQELKEQKNWCDALATASFIGAADVLNYQDKNNFLISEDFNYSINYAELRLDQRKEDCLRDYKESMDKIK